MKHIFVLIFLALSQFAIAQKSCTIPTPPKAGVYILDEFGLLSNQQFRSTNEKMRQYDAQTSIKIMVHIMSWERLAQLCEFATEQRLFDYACFMGDNWSTRDQNDNIDVAYAIAIKPDGRGSQRICRGEAMQTYFDDSARNRIEREVIENYFKAQNLDGGVMAIVDKIITELGPETVEQRDRAHTETLRLRKESELQQLYASTQQLIQKLHTLSSDSRVSSSNRNLALGYENSVEAIRDAQTQIDEKIKELKELSARANSTLAVIQSEIDIMQGRETWRATKVVLIWIGFGLAILVALYFLRKYWKEWRKEQSMKENLLKELSVKETQFKKIYDYFNMDVGKSIHETFSIPSEYPAWANLAAKELLNQIEPLVYEVNDQLIASEKQINKNPSNAKIFGDFAELEELVSKVQAIPAQIEKYKNDAPVLLEKAKSKMQKLNQYLQDSYYAPFRIQEIRNYYGGCEKTMNQLDATMEYMVAKNNHRTICEISQGIIDTMDDLQKKFHHTVEYHGTLFSLAKGAQEMRAEQLSLLENNPRFLFPQMRARLQALEGELHTILRSLSVHYQDYALIDDQLDVLHKEVKSIIQNSNDQISAQQYVGSESQIVLNTTLPKLKGDYKNASLTVERMKPWVDSKYLAPFVQRLQEVNMAFNSLPNEITEAKGLASFEQQEFMKGKQKIDNIKSKIGQFETLFSEIKSTEQQMEEAKRKVEGLLPDVKQAVAKAKSKAADSDVSYSTRSKADTLQSNLNGIFIGGPLDWLILYTTLQALQSSANSVYSSASSEISSAATILQNSQNEDNNRNNNVPDSTPTVVDTGGGFSSDPGGGSSW